MRERERVRERRGLTVEKSRKRSGGRRGKEKEEMGKVPLGERGEEGGKEKGKGDRDLP